jgi:hypothetical protein
MVRKSLQEINRQSSYMPFSMVRTADKRASFDMTEAKSKGLLFQVIEFRGGKVPVHPKVFPCWLKVLSEGKDVASD